MIDNGRIEIASLAFMRGRTLQDSFVIADEMQNATPEQVKMLLTRLGNNSRMIITGDLGQSDLRGRQNGLAELLDRIDAPREKALYHIQVVVLNASDVVRHHAVAEVLDLFD
eukprot:2455292-Prymnesium_polylepis.1